MKIKINRFHGVAIWKWGIDDEVDKRAQDNFEYYCRDLYEKICISFLIGVYVKIKFLSID